MPLVTTKELFARALKGGYAVGAFNVNNMEIVQGIFEAAIAEKSPLIIQVSAGARKYARHEYLIHLIQASIEMAKSSGIDIPIALHLDHGRTLEDVAGALGANFTSIMLDASAYDYEENVRLSAAAKAMCPEDVALETELGSIGGKEDDVAPEFAAMTNPDQAAAFVEATGTDMLAVSVGNVHGYAPDVRIDFDLLRRIQQQCPVPLVIHGASGLPPENLSALRDYGVVKVNVASDLRNAMIRAFGEAYVANPEENSLIKVSTAAVEAITETVVAKIRQLNPGLAS